MIPVTVTPTQINIGSEFMPRLLDLPKVLVVKPGETFELPADSTWDYIEVAGTLAVSRVHDTVVRFIHMVILPTGSLACGTEADPMPRRVEFVIRDVPIDTMRDPFQWGNSLLNFGRQDRCGLKKLEWCPLTAELAMGATTLALSADPVGWQVGDELLLPDTRLANSANAIPRREAKITIQAIAGRTVTLSKPLDFDHLAQREPDGTIVLQPRVANLTRNIIVRSDNPSGTPGHTANIGMGAMWCICYNENLGNGRTKAIKLDRTTATHVGTNQVGRYADHHHHAMGFGSMSIGNVLRGRGPGGGKWAMSTHGTHDAQIEGNIAIDFAGAGFVTEDGYETHNTFARNFSAYILGNHDGGEGTKLNVTLDNPGAEGAGIWLRGVQNAIVGNEAWNCSAGILILQFGQVIQDFPSTPGGVPDTKFNIATAVPTSFANNVTASNVFIGLEYWFIAKFPAVNHISSYNGRAQMFLGISGPAQIYLVNPTLVGLNGQTLGIDSGIAYVDSLEIDGGGRIVGNLIGMAHGGGNRLVRMAGTVMNPLRFQNATNISMQAVPREVLFENVKHVPLPGFPLQYIEFGTEVVWSGTGKFPPAMAMLPPATGKHVIKNWQGTGQNFQLFAKQQLGSLPAWPSDQFMFFGVPEVGLTMEQAWEKYGLSYGGEAIKDADVVPLEGLFIGLARPGLTQPLGQPRGVVTFPTARASAPIEPGADRFTWCYAALTGDPTGTGPMLRVSIDGGTPLLVGPPFREDWTTVRTFATRNLTEGTHEIRTWRTTPDQMPIMASEMVFPYVVGAVVVTPPSPCPPITVGPATLPSATVGTQYNQALTATGGVAPNIFSVVGALPPGLVLMQNLIIGTPTTPGTFTFTIQVKDANQCPGSQAYTVMVAAVVPMCPPITVSPTTLLGGTVGIPYVQPLTASGGMEPYQFSIVGMLPPGIVFQQNKFTGTPTTPGTFMFTVQVKDQNQCPGSQAYTISIAAAVPVTTWQPVQAVIERFGTEGRLRLRIGNDTFELMLKP